jgi:hypothetical protein
MPCSDKVPVLHLKFLVRLSLLLQKRLAMMTSCSSSTFLKMPCSICGHLETSANTCKYFGNVLPTEAFCG